MRRRGFAQKRSTAHLTAITVKEKFDQLADLGLALATRVQFRRLVADKRWGDAIQILEHVPKDFPFVERVFLADSAGVLQADSPELSGVRGKNFSHRDWYRGVLESQRSYISNVYTRAAEPRINVVAAATPIRGHDGGLKGILVLQIALGTLLEWTKSIEVGPDGFVYLVDRQGQIAAHPKYSGQGAVADFSSVPVVQRLLRGQADVEVLYNPIEKEERLSAYEPVQGYGWGVVAQQPTAAVFAERDNNLRRVAAVYGIALLAGLILSYLIQRSLAERRRVEAEIRRLNESRNSRRPNWRRPTRNWRRFPIPFPTICGRPCAASTGFRRRFWKIGATGWIIRGRITSGGCGPPACAWPSSSTIY